MLVTHPPQGQILMLTTSYEIYKMMIFNTYKTTIQIVFIKNKYCEI